jgi:hypothetical protein
MNNNNNKKNPQDPDDGPDVPMWDLYPQNFHQAMLENDPNGEYGYWSDDTESDQIDTEDDDDDDEQEQEHEEENDEQEEQEEHEEEHDEKVDDLDDGEHKGSDVEIIDMNQAHYLEGNNLYLADGTAKEIEGVVSFTPLNFIYMLGADTEQESKFIFDQTDNEDEYYKNIQQFPSTKFIEREFPIEDLPGANFYHYMANFNNNNLPVHHFRLVAPDLNFLPGQQFEYEDGEGYFVEPGFDISPETVPWWLIVFRYHVPRNNPKFQTLALYHFVRYKFIKLCMDAK